MLLLFWRTISKVNQTDTRMQLEFKKSLRLTVLPVIRTLAINGQDAVNIMTLDR